MNNKCCICQNEIAPERIEALKLLEISSNNFLCILCSLNINKPYKALYNDTKSNMVLVSGLGEYGISKEKDKTEQEQEENLDEF